MDGRITIDFNGGWLFQKLTQKSGLSEAAVEKTNYNDSDWEAVSLPHTWNAVDGADGFSGIDEGGQHYYRGLGGYRKRVFLSSEDYAGKRLFLSFDGANIVTDLFVNERFVGKHEGGYAAFRFDITDFVKLDSDNVIAVKVSNAPSEYIAPIGNTADFTKMGGIYRNVKLIAVDPLHIDLMDFGSSGIYVTPRHIAQESAQIDLKILLTNADAESRTVTADVRILDADNKTVACGSKNVCLAAGQKQPLELSVLLENLIFWNGAENPYLYQAEITLSDNGDVLDRNVQPFGVRTYRIDPDQGFFLNGKYLNLHGVGHHQDSYENGWAMTETQQERDYGLMRQMGANCIRMAHYQHGPYEYTLCDKLGIIVWTEIGIVDQMTLDTSEEQKIADGFVDNAKQQLTELIRQNYNHPSIVVWGISNELAQISDEIFEIYTELYQLVKREDGTRLAGFADNQFRGRYLELPGDVVGYNRYFGWYEEAGGGVEKFAPWFDEYHATKEKRPICVSEYGGGAAISQHKDNIVWKDDIEPWGKHHYENYQSALHEDIWAQFSTRPYLWAKLVWIMFDFACDDREEGDTKGQNDKGLVTRERIPKDAFYFYQSVWNSEPMVHLTERRFTNRPCDVPVVKAYSNAEQVELFVNGVSQGMVYRRDLDALYSTVFKWENVQLGVGVENQVCVKARFADNTELESHAVWYGIQ